MGRTHRAAGFATAITAACLAAMPVAAASAAPKKTRAKVAALTREIREVPPAKRYSTARLGLNRSPAPALGARAIAETPPVGTVRQWIALNDVANSVYRKDYTLRG